MLLLLITSAYLLNLASPATTLGYASKKASMKNALSPNSGAAYISVPFHGQDEDYYCGPAALEMVFDYYGEDIPQIEIADVARTMPYTTYTDELRRAAHFSNSSTSLGSEMPGNITGYSARKLGYAAFERGELTIDDLKTLIEAREPVIALMWMTLNHYGHYRVVIGYNETHIITHDPWFGPNIAYTYSDFLDLWQYSGCWGLLVTPWHVEVQMLNKVKEGTDLQVGVNITYPCSPPFDSIQYPSTSCVATIGLQPGLELGFGETVQHSLTDITAGTSVQTSWSILANETGLYNVSVTASGNVLGSVAQKGGLSSYNYEDRIGGSSSVGLSVIGLYTVHNLDSGLNYTTIQAAIDAPETLNGHTIKVDSWTYCEHLTVNKPVTLVGEDRDSTVVDGNGTGTVIRITTSDVAIINLTIGNAGRNWGPPPGTGYPDSCIFGSRVTRIEIQNDVICGAAASVVFIDESSFANVSDNIIFNSTYIGVLIYASYNSTVCHNSVYDYGSEGIHLDGGSYYCTILNNTVENGYDGISVEEPDTNSNLIDGNHLANNALTGVGFFNCGANVLKNNNVTACRHNILIWGFDLTNFMQDIDKSNTADNRPIWYLTGSSNLVVEPSNCSEIGTIALVNCTNVVIRGIDFTGNKDGILLAHSNNCTLTNVTLADNREPIIYGGFPLIYGDLTFFESNDNTIVNNVVRNNSYGVTLYHSDRNAFFHNSFTDIDKYVVPDFYSIFQNVSSGYFSACKWDNGIEGNFWGNYTGTDSNEDGISDTSYIIATNNTDNHPLMGTFSDFDATPEFHVQTICNSSISDFQFNGTAIVFNVCGENGTSGFCRICIPAALLNITCRVIVNGTEVTSYVLPCSNSTHLCLYFAYTHSTKQVVIVSEFPTFFLLLLLMMIASFTVTVLGRSSERAKATAKRNERVQSCSDNVF